MRICIKPKRKNLKTAGNIFIILLIIFAFSVPFMPRAICNKQDDIRIDRIVYNSHFGADDEYDRLEIVDYDSEKIIECISKYKSCLTLVRANGYQINDSELEISLSVNGKGKYIVLGNINYVNGGNGSFKRSILNHDELKEELEILLKLPEVTG